MTQTHPRVRRVVTSRQGGASRPPYDSFNLSLTVGDDARAVRANRQRLAQATQVPSDRFVWMATVHGTKVGYVDAPQHEPVAGVDGLVTTATGLALVVLAADCVPVLAADTSSGVVAVAHAGRRGAAGGIADSLVAAMQEAGARPGSTDVLLGPAICGRCYEVPEEMQSEVESALPGSASRTSAGTPGLDLRVGLRARLLALGVRHVVADQRCTYTDRTLFSFRRDGTTGRQAGVAWLT